MCFSITQVAAFNFNEQQPGEKVKITGTVTDEKGTPLPFAAVCFKGTTTGCTSAVDGSYTLEAPNEKDLILEVSSLGFATQTIPVNGRTVIDIIMIEVVKGLDEVVVTGYQSISKERATGSFAKLSTEDIENTLNNSVVDQLNGRVQGLLVNKDEITIRGKSTIYGNAEPLVVLDNFPLNSLDELNTLNPDDVASITVLKDAAAASIWGVRAANGVIIVTTKKGKSKNGSMAIDVSAKFFISEKDDISQLHLASSSDMINFEREAIYDKRWLDYSQPSYDLTHFGDKSMSYSRAQGIIFRHLANANKPGALNGEEEVLMDQELNALKNYCFKNEYKKHLLQKRFTQTYNVAFYGNSDVNSYRHSFTFENNNGHLIGHESNKITINSVNDFKVNSKFKVNFNILASYTTKKKNSSSHNMTNTKPYARIYDDNGEKVSIYNDTPEHHKAHFKGMGYLDWNEYIIDELHDKKDEDETYYIRANIGANYKILDYLTYNTQLIGNLSSNNNEILNKKGSYFERDLINRFTVVDDGMLTQKLPRGGFLHQQLTKNHYWAFRNQLSVNKDLFSDHHLNMIIGTEINSQSTSYTYSQRVGYDNQTLFNDDNINWPGLLNTIIYSGARGSYALGNREKFNEDRFASFYTNIGYSIKNKYSLSLSARQDQSNLFGANSDYSKNALWSTGVAWQLHQEDFFKSDLFDRLVVRATYGVNGNIDKTTFPVLTIISGQSFLTGEKATNISNPPNKELRWERVKVWNIGVDFALLNNNLSGSIEAYNRESTDLLGIAKLDYTSGFSSAKINTANMYNRGFDLNLFATPIKKEINWSINFNFGYNYNKVTNVELAENSAQAYLKNSPISDQSLYRLYAYKWAGLNNKGEAQIYNEKGEIVNYSQPVTSPKALAYEGVTTPKYYGGMMHHFTYKNWSANFNLSYGFGHKMRMPAPNYNNALYANTYSSLNDRWRQPGDEKHINIPGLPETLEQVNNSYRTHMYELSSANIDNASYIKLNSVGIGYDIVQIPKLQKLRIMLQANNIWMWTANDMDIDPTVVSGVLPNPKSFQISLKTTF